MSRWFWIYAFAIGLWSFFCGYYLWHQPTHQSVTPITFKSLERADCGRLKMWAEITTDSAEKSTGWTVYACSATMLNAYRSVRRGIEWVKMNGRR